MLRALVLILFLANLLFYLWTQGMLTSVVGVQPGGQHEPDRLTHQVHPEVIRVLPPESAGAAGVADSAAASAADTASVEAVATPASSASDAASGAAAAASATSAPDAVACLEAGPYTLAERVQVEAKLKPILKPGDWMDTTHERAGAWMVYMGRYASDDMLHKKEEELRRIKIDYTIVHAPPELANGLSLGQYEQRADADAALAKVASHGVRTARLVVARQPDIAHVLRVPRATPTQQASLSALPTTAWLGRGLKPCGTVSPEP